MEIGWWGELVAISEAAQSVFRNKCRFKYIQHIWILLPNQHNIDKMQSNWATTFDLVLLNILLAWSKLLWTLFIFKVAQIFKVNSVQEAFAKCFAVHLLEFEILQTTWKNKTKNIKILNIFVKNCKLKVWCNFFHVICKISHFHTYVNCKAFGASFLYSHCYFTRLNLKKMGSL